MRQLSMVLWLAAANAVAQDTPGAGETEPPLVSAGEDPQPQTPPPPPPSAPADEVSENPFQAGEAYVRRIHGDVELSVGFGLVQAGFGSGFGFTGGSLGGRYYFGGVKVPDGTHFRVEEFLQHPSMIGLGFGQGLHGAFYPWERTGITANLQLAFGGLGFALGGGLGAIHYLAPNWRLEGGVDLSSFGQGLRIGTGWVTSPGADGGRFLNRVTLSAGRHEAVGFEQGPDGPVVVVGRGLTLGVNAEALLVKSAGLAFGLRGHAGFTRQNQGTQLLQATSTGGALSAEIELLPWLIFIPALNGSWSWIRVTGLEVPVNQTQFSIGPNLGVAGRF